MVYTDYFKNSLILSNHTKTTIVTPLKAIHETSGETPLSSP